MRVLGVIPARLNSSRLPRKVLRTLCGKPMIQWVYEAASLSNDFDELLVATDAREVANACEELRIPVVMTSDKHRSGTERVAEVLLRHPAEVVVNIQGDEPLIAPEHIHALLEPMKRGVGVCTLSWPELTDEEVIDPNVVKVVTDQRGSALYFSRMPIPGAKHIGIYAYWADVLDEFCELPPSRLEKLERLEQLRFLENGIPIRVDQAPSDTIGVDNEDDLKRAEAALAGSL